MKSLPDYAREMFLRLFFAESPSPVWLDSVIALCSQEGNKKARSVLEYTLSSFAENHGDPNASDSLQAVARFLPVTYRRAVEKKALDEAWIPYRIELGVLVWACRAVALVARSVKATPDQTVALLRVCITSPTLVYDRNA